MHGYARRNSAEGLASDTARRAAGQIGESGPPRSTDVRKGSVTGGRSAGGRRSVRGSTRPRASPAPQLAGQDQSPGGTSQARSSGPRQRVSKGECGHLFWPHFGRLSSHECWPRGGVDAAGGWGGVSSRMLAPPGSQIFTSVSSTWRSVRWVPEWSCSTRSGATAALRRCRFGRWPNDIWFTGGRCARRWRPLCRRRVRSTCAPATGPGSDRDRRRTQRPDQSLRSHHSGRQHQNQDRAIIGGNAPQRVSANRLKARRSALPRMARP